MLKDVFVLNPQEKYPYTINNNGDLFVKGNYTNYKVDSKGRVTYNGSFVSDRLDYNTWVSIINKTFKK